MVQEPGSQFDTLYKPLNLKNGMGYVLILSGLGTALGVLLEIYTLFVDPNELAFFRQLFPDRLSIGWEGGLLTVPPEILAYGLPIVLLSIAVGIVNTLINAGMNLLRPGR
jgi:hypothetical protein